jgi:hypothetical protein
VTVHPAVARSTTAPLQEPSIFLLLNVSTDVAQDSFSTIKAAVKQCQGMRLFSSSENVQQTFQFADVSAIGALTSHQQTGKFALHRALPSSSFQGVAKRHEILLFHQRPGLLKLP